VLPSLPFRFFSLYLSLSLFLLFFFDLSVSLLDLMRRLEVWSCSPTEESEKAEKKRRRMEEREEKIDCERMVFSFVFFIDLL